jgi:hypothetical protein
MKSLTTPIFLLALGLLALGLIKYVAWPALERAAQNIH